MHRLLGLLALAPLAIVACGPTAGAQSPAAAASPTCSPVARAPRPAGSPPAGFTPGQGAFAGQGRPVATGTVDSYSGGVMTVADRRSGQVVKVTISSSTSVTGGFGRGSASPAPAKITKGESVSVFGTQAADGTVTATRVLVLPANAAPGCGRPRSTPAPAQG